MFPFESRGGEGSLRRGGTKVFEEPTLCQNALLLDLQSVSGRILLKPIRTQPDVNPSHLPIVPSLLVMASSEPTKVKVCFGGIGLLAKCNAVAHSGYRQPTQSMDVLMLCRSGECGSTTRSFFRRDANPARVKTWPPIPHAQSRTTTPKKP